ncbi:MAG: hypothetical protein COA75_13520 [Cellvibrionales bacterium]|nr:MAG: hypothetical protein COA75_13520 [Cellvibrionales bacterium]
MDNISAITTFFGWCTVVNLGIYAITALALTLFRNIIKDLHSKLMGVPTDKLDELYFNYLGKFKLAIITLSITPYIALKVMGS